MYCTFYGFNERPFTLTPNPAFIFLSRVHQEAFAHLIYGIENRTGFIMLTGEVGAGKTTVIRTLLAELKPESYATALILNPMVSVEGLLRTVLREFGIDGSGAHESAEMVEALNHFLLQQRADGRTAVLVIDEAQDMEPAVLEQVRLLSNLETTNDKLIQIILVGQPELEVLMQRTDLRQLNQRITVRFHLTSMGLGDTEEYIRHRIKTAVSGAAAVPNFSNGAVKAIYQFSNGLPRLINAAADRSLLIAFNQSSREITRTIAQQAITDISSSKKIAKKNVILKFLIPGIALCLIVGAGILLYLNRNDHTSFSAAQADQQVHLQFSILKEWYGVIAATVAAVLCGIGIAYFKWRSTKKEVPHSSNAQTIETNNAGKKQEQHLFQAVLSALASLWGQPVLPSIHEASPERALQTMGFAVYKYTGNLAGIIRLGYPALLECTTQAPGTKKFILLIGVSDDETLHINDGHHETTRTPSEVLPSWTGRALVPWKNFLGVSVVPYQQMAPEQRHILLQLLSAADVWPNDPHDTSEQALRSAIMTFQKQQEIPPSGDVGPLTLMKLYQVSKKASMSPVNKDNHCP